MTGDDEREVYWRQPVPPADVRKMLRDMSKRTTLPPQQGEPDDAPAPRWPTFEDYIELGLSPEEAARAIANFKRDAA